MPDPNPSCRQATFASGASKLVKQTWPKARWKNISRLPITQLLMFLWFLRTRSPSTAQDSQFLTCQNEHVLTVSGAISGRSLFSWVLKDTPVTNMLTTEKISFIGNFFHRDCMTAYDATKQLCFHNTPITIVTKRNANCVYNVHAVVGVRGGVNGALGIKLQSSGILFGSTLCVIQRILA